MSEGGEELAQVASVSNNSSSEYWSEQEMIFKFQNLHRTILYSTVTNDIANAIAMS